MPGATVSAPELQLALALVGTQARRERHRARIEELASRADFGALESFLRGQGMLALVSRRLLEVVDAPPESFMQSVEEYTRLAERQGVYQQMVTLRLAAALTEADIRALPLKGPMLSERIHEKIDRVSADIDLLVPALELARATEIMAGFGYTCAFSRDASRERRPDLHKLLRSSNGLPEVELHWRVHWYEERFSAEMLQQATLAADGSLRPTPVHELAALLLFYARDGFAGLRLLADITAWWDRFGDALASGEADELAGRHPEIARLLATSALVAAELGGLPAQKLFGRASLARASQRAMRLSNWPLRGGAGQVGANASLIDWLLTPSDGRRDLLRRRIWPSEEALCLRWPQVAANGIGQLRARWILHLLLDWGRYALALWQTRSREWAPPPTWLAGPDALGG